MNILIFYQYFGTPRGSWSTRIYELSLRWVKAGHKVTVVTAPYEKSDIKTDKWIDKQCIEGINLIVINSGDSNRIPIWKRAFRSFVYALVSIYYALTISADMVVCSSGPITVGVPGIFAKIFRKRKFIFEVRDLWPAGGIEMGKIRGVIPIRLALWFEKLCYNKADLIVTASTGQTEHIRQRFPNLKFLEIPNASDNDMFGGVHPSFSNLESLNKAKSVFLHIGSLGYIHNCSFVLDAAIHLKKMGRDDIEIIFIGDGAERSMLESYAEENKLKNVSFLGLKPKREIPAWLATATATLFTTLNNPVQDTCSPNKIFDSFAASKPIIQTTTGWIGKMVDDEQCGINIAPGDSLGFAQAMTFLADNPSVQQNMADSALRLAHTTFNREHLASKYLSEIERVVYA